MIVAITLFLIGGLIGVLASFFGIGGGGIIVPFLLLKYPSIPIQMVIQTSLASNLFIAAHNVYLANKRKELPRPKVLFSLFITILLGSVIGTLCTDYINRDHFRFYFSFILYIVMIRTLLSLRKKKGGQIDGQEISFVDAPYFYEKLLFSGLLGGFISAVSGLAGGVVFVPYFLTVLKMPFKTIPLYSNSAMAMSCILGLINGQLLYSETQWEVDSWVNSFSLGPLNFVIIFLIMIGGLSSQRIGKYLGEKISESRKKVMYACLLFILATRMITS